MKYMYIPTLLSLLVTAAVSVSFVACAHEASSSAETSVPHEKSPAHSEKTTASATRVAPTSASAQVVPSSASTQTEPRTPAAAETPPGTLNSGHAWSASDPALKYGDLTIWKLQEMAQSRQYDDLNKLFNHGLSMERLPVGYAAGRGSRVLNIGGAFGKILVAITGANWYGKIFYNSADPKNSHGLNRIRQRLGDSDTPIEPMGAFTTQLRDAHELVPEVTSNFVILNYAHPESKNPPNIQEVLIKKIPVYDVMVAVPGKYGPLYVGKTWYGSYDSNGEFHAQNAKKLIAWYFLDYNAGALREQQDRMEIKIDPNAETKAL